jgi:L-alanine-DL-glutamate epimerase-like enolase superfamily enzyme
MLSEPYTIDADGKISVPDAPGFGFKLNRAVIRDCTVQTWESGGSL